MRRVNKYLIAGIAIFCLVLAGQAAGLLAARYLAPRIENALGRRLDANVEIQGLDFKWITGVHMEGLVIKPETGGKCRANGIRLDGIAVNYAFLSLFYGDIRITRVAVESAEACVDRMLVNRLFSDDLFRPAAGAIPGIEIQSGTIRVLHPILEEPLQFYDLSASGRQGGPLQIKARASFDKGKNNIHINLSAARSGIGAEMWVRRFDTASLPDFQFQNRSLDPSAMKLEKGVSGSVSARFSPKTGMVTIENGQLDAPAGSLEIFSGGISADSRGIQRAWIRAGARGMDLVHLNKLSRQVITTERFQTDLRAGRFRTNFHVRWCRETGLDYEAEVSVHNGAASFTQQDITIREIEADAEIFSPGRMIIEKCRGRVSDGRVDLSGALDFSGSEIKQYRLAIELHEIPGDQNLQPFMHPGVWEVIDEMQIQQALLNGRIRLAPGEIGVNLQVKGESAHMPNLPFKLGRPSTRINWHSGTKKVLFNDFKAFIQGSPISGQAALTLDKPLRTDFTLFGQYLPITPEIRQWMSLEKTPWQISGSYDIEIRGRNWELKETSIAEALQNLKVQADLRDVSLIHSRIGRVAEDWYGHLGLHDGQVRLTDFTGEIFGVSFRGSGGIPVDRPEETYLNLESQAITLEESLYQRLPFGRYLQKAGLKGQCELKAELRTAGKEKLPTKGNIAAVIHQFETGAGNIRAGGAGTARIRFSGLDREDLILAGNVNLHEGFLNRFEVNRLSADFRYQDGIVRVPDMQIGAYGGTIRFVDASVNTLEHTWQTRISPSHMDLESIVAAFGITGRKTPSGSLRGEIELRGKGRNPEAIKGGGKLKITRGMLYHFPIMTSVFSVLDLQIPRQSPITDAYVDFGVQGGSLRLNDVLLSGGTVPMHMSGTVGLKNDTTFKQQKIDLLVTTAKSNGLLDRIPLVNWVKHYTLDVFRRLIMQVTIKGKLGDYEVNRLTSPVTDPIEQMWSLMKKLAPEPPE